MMQFEPRLIWASLAIAAVGGVLSSLGWTIVGTIFLGSGCLGAGLSLNREIGGQRVTNLRTWKWLLLALTLTGGFLRFVHLVNMPPGIWLDEGRGGWWALRFLRGETWWGQLEAPEPIATCLFAIAFRWFGSDLLVSRCVTAVLGTLTIPAMAWFLSPMYGQNIALCGAALLAVCRWHILVSRLATNYVLLPLFVVMSLGFFDRATRSRRLALWIISGACTGLSIYTYLPGRAIPPVFVALIVANLYRNHWDSVSIRGSAAFLATLLIVSLPMVIHWYEVPASFHSRALDLSGAFLSHPLRVAFHNFAGFLTFIHLRGDGSVISSFPRGAFDPALGVAAGALTLVGFPSLVSGSPVTAKAFMMLWVFVMGVVTSMTGVSEIRMVGLLPLIVISQAIGMVRLCGVSRSPRAVLVVLMGVVSLQECPGFLSDHFWKVAREEVEISFRVQDRNLANAIIRSAQGRPTYRSPDMASPSHEEELFKASVYFLIDSALRKRVPETLGDLKRDNGQCVFLILTKNRRELLAEIFPGGREIIQETSIQRGVGGGFYLVDAMTKSRMTLREYKILLDSLEAAQQAESGHDSVGALAILTNLERRWPWLAEVAIRRASILAGRGLVEEFIREAGRALLLNPTSPRALVVEGLALARRDRIAEAMEYWIRAVQIDNRQEVAWYNLVGAYLKLGDPAGAVRTWRRASLYNPNSIALSGLGAELAMGSSLKKY